MLEAFAPSMSEEVRSAQSAALERAMAPETVQRQLLDFPSIVYAAGNGQRYRGGDTGATPTKREVFGTGNHHRSQRRPAHAPIPADIAIPSTYQTARKGASISGQCSE